MAVDVPDFLDVDVDTLDTDGTVVNVPDPDGLLKMVSESDGKSLRSVTVTSKESVVPPPSLTPRTVVLIELSKLLRMGVPVASAVAVPTSAGRVVSCACTKSAKARRTGSVTFMGAEKKNSTRNEKLYTVTRLKLLELIILEQAVYPSCIVDGPAYLDIMNCDDVMARDETWKNIQPRGDGFAPK